MGRGRLNHPERRIIIPYGPMAHQAKMHSCPSRFKLIVGGRRVGKSKSCLNEIIRHSFTTEKALSWWISPTYSEAREVGFEEFLGMQEDIGPGIHSVHKGNMRVEFINGSKLYFKGADRKDSLRGRGLTLCVMDEAAFQKAEIWHKVLRPALADRKGSGLLATTPNGRGNWIYQLWLKIAGGGTTWDSFRWASMLNPLIDAVELEAMRQDMSDMEFRQEVLAEFVTRSGQVFEDFSEANKIDFFNPDPRLHHIYLAADFGFVNPSAVGFFAVDRLNERVTLFDEVYGSKFTIDTIQTMISEKLGKYNMTPKNVQAIFTDPAGNAAELTSGLSPVDQLRKNYVVHNKGTQIAPGLALVRRFIKNANDVRNFFVVKHCVESIRSLEGYVYPPAMGHLAFVKEEPLKDGLHDHACDMIRYFFVNKFDHAKWITDRLNIDSYTATVSSRKVLKHCSECHGTFVSDTPKNKPPFTCAACAQKAESGGQR